MTRGIGIAEVEDAIAIDADGVGAVAVPVTHHRVVTGLTQFNSNIGSARELELLGFEGCIARTECSRLYRLRLWFYLLYKLRQL